MLRSAIHHFQQAPFVAATACAALIHSTWTVGTAFAGPQPNITASPAAPEFIVQVLQYGAWVLPAFLVAVALDVGLLSTAADIQAGARNKAKTATFFVLAASMYYMQWLYMAAHMPEFQLASGVELGREAAEFLTGAALWIIPALLPLSILLHTIGNVQAQPAAPQKATEAAVLSVERPHSPALPEGSEDAETDALEDTQPQKAVAYKTGVDNPQSVKECEHCGATFRTRSSVKKYCSDSCRAMAANKRKKRNSYGRVHDETLIEGVQS